MLLKLNRNDLHVDFRFHLAAPHVEFKHFEPNAQEAIRAVGVGVYEEHDIFVEVTPKGSLVTNSDKERESAPSNTFELTVKVKFDECISRAEAVRLLQSVLDVGHADAVATMEDNENFNVDAAAICAAKFEAQ